MNFTGTGLFSLVSGHSLNYPYFSLGLALERLLIGVHCKQRYVNV